MVTLLMHGVLATPMQVQPRSVAGSGNVSPQYYPTGQYQIDDPSGLWSSLLPSKDQLALPLTIQRKNAHSTISLQNSALLMVAL
ncbi:MAG: hypothetical protein ABI988_01555 [Nitrospirota bacterium]